MSYYDNRDAKVKIMGSLVDKGWKVFGYSPDQSDMMTDYYHPASWGGIATKNGYVLVIDNHSNSNSGYEVKKYNHNKTSYQATARIVKLEAMMNDAASTENEKASCAVLIEKEKEKQGIAPTYTIEEVYPTFAHGNPKASNWHIEKDGQILAKGNGAFAVNNYDWENEEVSAADQKAEKLKKFINKIEKVLTDSDALKTEVVKVAKQVIKPVQKENNEINEGDILSFDYHGHYWIVTRVYTVGGQVRINYEILGSEKRGYQRTRNAKGYYQPLVRLEKEMTEGKVKVYTLQEVTEYVEKTVFKKTKRIVKASDAVQIESNEVVTEQPEQEQEATQAEIVNAETVTAGEAVLTINNEKNGIEIAFTSKPSVNVIEALKENGFRWSSYGGKWWAKQTEDRLKFAQMIVGDHNSATQEEPEQNEEEAAEEVAETTEQAETVQEKTEVETELSHNSQATNEPAESKTEEVKAEPVIINGKITVKEITFIWSESSMIKDETTVSTFAEAEQLIRNAAQKVKVGYDKTKYCITWTDGDTYTGRIDIDNDHVGMTTPIKNEITDWVLFLTGDNKPAHMTDRSYAEHLAMYNISDSEKQEYYNFLEEYALTDIEANNSDNMSEPADNVIYHNFNDNSSANIEQEESEPMTMAFDDIFSKFDNVDITTESKVNAEDLEFCKEQENIYRQTMDAYNSLNEQLQEVKAIAVVHGKKYGELRSNYFHEKGSALNAGFSVYVLEKNIINIKNRFISNIFYYFMNKYNITVNYEAIQKKYDTNVTYENIIDEITIQLGGYNFNEKAEQEIKQKFRESVTYEKVSPKGNKLIINAFLYIDTSWKQWGTEKIHYNSSGKIEQLFNALQHYENGSTVLSEELQAICKQIQNGKNEEVFGTHELNLSKIKAAKIFKNGKVEIEFSSNQQATKFNKEYCNSNVA